MGRVRLRMVVRNSAMTTSSNELTKAKTAPPIRLGIRAGSMTSLNIVGQEAPMPSAASSRLGSRLRSAARMVM
ncbi:hypothetical protein D3C76_1846000 [compost metagenome]